MLSQETGISLQHGSCECQLQSQLVQGRETTQLPFPHLSEHADTRKPSGRTAPLDQSKSEQDFTLPDSRNVSTIKVCHMGRKTKGATSDKGIQDSQQFSLPANLVLKPKAVSLLYRPLLPPTVQCSGTVP